MSDDHVRAPGSESRPSPDDLGFELPQPARFSRGKALGIAAVVALALGGAFVAGYVPRRHAQKALAAESHATDIAALRVQVITPKTKASDRSVVLAGSVQALEETIVYPRANGYIRSWKFDIGDKVNEGDPLAEIDTPELDSQIAQARAQLLQAEASLAQSKASEELSIANRARYEKLAPSGVASQQELDQSRAKQLADEANVTAARANIAAQKANLERLVQMKSFARIVAPFSGRVNARMVERGALVSSSTALFKISNTDPVRVFIQVPQDLAPSVRPDVVAHVTVREYGGRVFEGKVTRSAGSLDAQTRTMNTEVRVPNGDNALLVGMYAQVALSLPTPHRVLELPSTAILNDAKGVRVAVVDAQNRVKLVPVGIERDTGATIELASGIEANDRVVKLANADLVDGRAVEIVP